MIGLRKPRNEVLGLAIAGRVDAVADDVADLRSGDEVYADVSRGVVSRGGFAEYACVPRDELAPKPSNLTFAQAAAVPVVGTTALKALRDLGRVRSGQTVLVNGASGGVGAMGGRGHRRPRAPRRRPPRPRRRVGCRRHETGHALQEFAGDDLSSAQPARGFAQQPPIFLQRVLFFPQQLDDFLKPAHDLPMRIGHYAFLLAPEKLVGQRIQLLLRGWRAERGQRELGADAGDAEERLEQPAGGRVGEAVQRQRVVADGELDRAPAKEM
jgi:hypothetical protein